MILSLTHRNETLPMEKPNIQIRSYSGSSLRKILQILREERLHRSYKTNNPTTPNPPINPPIPTTLVLLPAAPKNCTGPLSSPVSSPISLGVAPNADCTALFNGIDDSSIVAGLVAAGITEGGTEAARILALPTGGRD
ncbi:hypothetical protein BHYA_0041g00570 [Botrytis hyacinthi]|uniref:Uncharacterized protein n=1 Tax=Botrytis hyacinthi TaxID=278943 RepID=A0A4Z1GYP9_9HELO|nr:hypothetical protein BHYA_0041g00570 [Botrytis hyacinthi]